MSSAEFSHSIVSANVCMINLQKTLIIWLNAWNIDTLSRETTQSNLF